MDVSKNNNILVPKPILLNIRQMYIHLNLNPYTELIERISAISKADPNIKIICVFHLLTFYN
jgi:hypothetical protein